jgi:protein O-GlcNAc transferase
MSTVTIQEAIELGLQHHQAGRLSEAEAVYQQILAEHPGNSDALHLLGLSAHQQGNHVLAIELLDRAIASNSNVAAYYSNLALILKEVGHLDRAAVAFQAALRLRGDYTEDHYNLGVVLQELRQYDGAISCYRQAVAKQPDLAKAWNNLGNVLRATGHPDEGITAYLQAIHFSQPVLAMVQSNLGNAYKDQGRLDAALECYRSAVALQPSNAQMHCNLVYSLHFHPAYDQHALAAENRRWRIQHADPLRQFVETHTNDRNPDRRLKIGYVSPNFCEQAESYFVVPLLEAHDRDLYEIHCYSSVTRPDAVTARLQKSCSAWHEVQPLSDEALAAKIRSDGIDLLVDLTMHMAHSRLLTFARKPAPVQITWLAYPGSTGLTTIDYRWTDAHMEPLASDDSWSSEQPLRLPDSWCCYDALSEPPPVNELPAEHNGYLTVGSFNNPCKYNSHVFKLWSRALRSVPQSRLLLLAAEGNAREWFSASLAAAGISPDRISFVPPTSRRDYFQYYHQIDLAFDPFPYNGITTTCDSLSMGVPVLNLVGITPAARAGLSLLSTVGLSDFATISEEEFIASFVNLCHNLPRLAALRCGLRQQMHASPLMNANRFARQVESSYRSVWRNWCAV